MEKVKVTQAQADLIKSIKDTDYAINIHGLNKRPDSSLQELTTAELARALYVGYEVEPEYSVGDWVVCDEMKIIGQLVEVDGELRVDSIDYNVPQSIRLDKLRHATLDEIEEEKERRWWAKHGRDVWELKQGDILMGIHRALYEVTADPKSHRFGYYTGNDSRYFEIGECKRDGWKVVCFAEDRKDA